MPRAKSSCVCTWDYMASDARMTQHYMAQVTAQIEMCHQCHQDLVLWVSGAFSWPGVSWGGNCGGQVSVGRVMSGCRGLIRSLVCRCVQSCQLSPNYNLLDDAPSVISPRIALHFPLLLILLHPKAITNHTSQSEPHTSHSPF